VYGARMRRPDAKGGAIGHQVGAHRGTGVDMIE
jgi:hypothetical protein